MTDLPTTRIEHDLLGEIAVPAAALWGAHTERARGQGNMSSRMVHPALIAALVEVKRACATANARIGVLDQTVADAIVAACEAVLAGKHEDAFPLDAIQGGAGTSTNMNVNEVLATLANRHANSSDIKPLEHVNLHQSTNDVYPTALKIGAIRGVRRLAESFANLQGELQKQEAAFARVVKLGRTEWQPAVPLTLGAEFSIWAEAVARDRWRTFKCEERLRVVNLGGTAIGTGLTAPREYIFCVTDTLREQTGLPLARAENLIEQTANADAFVEVAGILRASADNLIKVSRDLRLLHMLGEIRLPAVQAGSSIMPGKVNPVVCEAVVSAGLLARSHCGLVSDCAMLGTLELNEWLPLLAHALLEAIDLLCNASVRLAAHVSGIEADSEKCAEYLNQSDTLITAFLPQLGYHRVESLLTGYRQSDSHDLRAFLSDKLGEETVASTLSPENLMSLGHRTANHATHP